MPKDAFDATPSWSGYTYQGKLALLHSLKVIVDLTKKDLLADLPDYYIELEWEEDFAIKKGKIYLSLHQVKAYKVSSPSKYKSALQNLFPKIAQNKDALGYLHVWKDIEYTVDIKNFEEMKVAYNDAKVDATTLGKVSIYDYEGRKYCELERVAQYVSKEIECYYKLKGETKTTAQIDYAVIALFQLVDKHVMFRHKNQDDAKQPKEIPLSDLVTAINYNYEEASPEYLFLKSKDFVVSMISKFCDNMALCKKESCELSCGVKKIGAKIEGLTPSEVFYFIMNRTPDAEINRSSIGIDEYRKVCNEVGVKNVLLRIFYELPQECFNDKKGIYINSDKTSYLPTTLHESDNSAEIAMNIISNPSLDAILSLYNFDKFISKDVLIEDLVSMAGGLKSWDPAVVSAFVESDGEKINKIKRIKVLPMQDAKGEVQ